MVCNVTMLNCYHKLKVKPEPFCLQKWWWRKWYSDDIQSAILSVCLKPSKDFGFFSVQNCCQSILTRSQTSSNNVLQNGADPFFCFPDS